MNFERDVLGFVKFTTWVLTGIGNDPTDEILEQDEESDRTEYEKCDGYIYRHGRVTSLGKQLRAQHNQRR